MACRFAINWFCKMSMDNNWRIAFFVVFVLGNMEGGINISSSRSSICVVLILYKTKALSCFFCLINYCDFALQNIHLLNLFYFQWFLNNNIYKYTFDKCEITKIVFIFYSIRFNRAKRRRRRMLEFLRIEWKLRDKVS